MKKVIIPCKSAEELGKKIAESAGAELARYEQRRFPDNEIYFRIDTDLKGCEAIVVQTGYPEPNSSLIELFLAVDICKNLNAKKITLIIPYFPYARQDKRFKDGEAYSLEVTGKILKMLGVDKLITMDAHFRKDYGKYDFFGIESYNLSAGTALASFIKNEFKLDSLHLISPDLGASEMISKAAKEANATSTTLKKVRKGDYEVEMSGKIEVDGKNVVVLDDIISTGGTMMRAIEKAKESGAEKVVAAATHGIFAGDSLEKLKKAADYVVTTDSIQNPTSEVSLAKIIAEAL